MNVSTIRQQIHQYIDVFDDNEIIALFSFLENKIGNRSSYTQEEINMLQLRVEGSMKINAKLYTVEEAHHLIRQQRKNT